MEQNHVEGEGLYPSSEKHEGLRINSIVIPAEPTAPLRRDELGAASLADYQRLVGGLIQRLSLEQPLASMYINEEGKLHGLPINSRATMLLWAHNPAFRYADIIVGDGFLVGRADRRGTDTSVPDEYVELLLEARQFHIEVQPSGASRWVERGERFDQWTTAYAHALQLIRQSSEVADIRVIPEG